MSVDPVTPAEYPPWHDQDEEKDLKEHFDPTAQDAFGNEEEAEVKYKVLSWWYVPRRPPRNLFILYAGWYMLTKRPQAMWTTCVLDFPGFFLEQD